MDTTIGLIGRLSKKLTKSGSAFGAIWAKTQIAEVVRSGLKSQLCWPQLATVGYSWLQFITVSWGSGGSMVAKLKLNGKCETTLDVCV